MPKENTKHIRIKVGGLMDQLIEKKIKDEKEVLLISEPLVSDICELIASRYKE